MALAFSGTKGSAKKGLYEQFEYKTGDNKIRLFGGVLARYVYWVKGRNNKNIPVECLGFNRETETFDNIEKDWVRHFYPDLKCGWAYAMLGIDTDSNTIKVVNLKKKLFEQIINASEDLGDPTDIETGWDVCFKRTKTGPLAYNVEYQLQPLKCKPTPLTDAQRELIADAAPIDEVYKRPDADAQKTFLESLMSESEESNVDSEVQEEFDIA